MQICDELFELRQHAGDIDASNKKSTASCFAWVTLQALGKMDEYLKAKFKHHSTTTGAFIRFLTKQMVESSAAGCSSKVNTLESSVKTIKDKQSNFSTKAAMDKVENKLEAVIKANQLKRKSEWLPDTNVHLCEEKSVILILYRNS